MKSKTVKRLLATVCATAVVVGSLAGCGSKSSTESSDSATSSTESTGGVTLSLMTATSWNSDSLAAGIELYEAATGNTVDMEVIPDEQIDDLIKTRLATNADVPDIIAYHEKVYTSQQMSSYFAPLTGDWVNKLNESHLESFYKQEDGNVYMAPYGSATALGLIYNKEIMAANNIELPITSYTDFVAACETLKANGQTPISISNKEGWTAQILGLDHNLSEFTPEEYEALKTGQLSYEDVDYLQTMLSNMEGLRDKGFINEDYMSTTMDMSIEDVATGECAMTPAGDWSYASLVEVFPDAVDNVGMMPIPMSDEVMYVNIGVSSKMFWATQNGKAGNVDAGVEFIDFMMSDDTLMAMYDVEAGICPVQGLDVNQNSWNAEMVGYGETIPYAKIVGELNGFNSGDFATSIQQLFGGKSVQDTLAYWYDDCVQVNKAAGTEGF